MIVTNKHLDNRDILPIFVHTNKASLLHTLGRTGFGSGFSSKPPNVTVFTNVSFGQF